MARGSDPVKSARRERTCSRSPAGHGRVGQVRVRVRNREDRRAVSTPTRFGLRRTTRSGDRSRHTARHAGIERNRQRPRRGPRRQGGRGKGGSTPQRGRPPSLRKRTSAPIGWSRPRARLAARRRYPAHLHEDALPAWYGQHRHRGERSAQASTAPRPGDLEAASQRRQAHARRPGDRCRRRLPGAHVRPVAKRAGEARVTDVQAIARSSSGKGGAPAPARAASTTSSVPGIAPAPAEPTPGQERPWGPRCVGVQARDDLGRIDVRRDDVGGREGKDGVDGTSGAGMNLRPAVGWREATGRGIFESCRSAVGAPSTLPGPGSGADLARRGHRRRGRAACPAARDAGRRARAPSPRGRPFRVAGTVRDRPWPRPDHRIDDADHDRPDRGPGPRPGFAGEFPSSRRQHGLTGARTYRVDRDQVPAGAVPAGSRRSQQERPAVEGRHVDRRHDRPHHRPIFTAYPAKRGHPVYDPHDGVKSTGTNGSGWPARPRARAEVDQLPAPAMCTASAATS